MADKKLLNKSFNFIGLFMTYTFNIYKNSNNNCKMFYVYSLIIKNLFYGF